MAGSVTNGKYRSYGFSSLENTWVTKLSERTVMVGEIRTPASPLPRQLKDKREARENKEKGIPPEGTPPVAPAPVAPVAPAPETPAPQPIESPAPPEPVTPTPPPAPAITPTPSPAPEEKPKEGIVPTAPPAPKVVGKKEGETSDDALTRMSAALKILQGKYNAEVPHLMKENARLVKENADLQTEQDKAKAEHERLTSENEELKKKTVQAVSKELTEDEKNVAKDLGIENDSFIALKNVILAGVPKPQELPVVKAPVEKPSEETKEEPVERMSPVKRTYLETLDRLIGGWEVRESIVKDKKFEEFLSLFDRNSQKPIHELAREADDSFNAVTMAEVYTAFLDWKNQPPVPKPSTPTSQLMPNPKGGSSDLKSNKKPIYTEQQYEDFKRKVTRGDYRTLHHTPEEAKKITDERDYWSEEFRTAKMEGRIVASQE